MATEALFERVGMPRGMTIRVETVSADGQASMRSLVQVQGDSITRIHGVEELDADALEDLSARHQAKVLEEVQLRDLWGNRLATWPERLTWIVGLLWLGGELTLELWGTELQADLQVILDVLVAHFEGLLWSAFRTAVVTWATRALLRWVVRLAIDRLLAEFSEG